MIRVLTAGSAREIEPRPDRSPAELWMSAEDLRAATGWNLAAEGLCRAEVCIPLTDAMRGELVDGPWVHASALWRALERPLLHDEAHTTWMLGEAASERARALETLQAPDFELPDIHGTLHRLSDHRGKKVLLATWASW